MKRTALLLSIAMIPGLGSMAAAEDETPPISPLVSIPFAGDRWFDVEVDVPAGGALSVGVSYTTRRDLSFGADELYLLDDAGGIVDHWHGITRYERGASASAALPSPAGRVQVSTMGGDAPFGSASFHYPPSAGRYRIVLIEALDGVMEGAMHVGGSAGVTLVSHRSGPATFVLDEDMQGTAAYVRAGATRVRAASGEVWTDRFPTGRWFGRFVGANRDVRVRYEGPEGADVGDHEYFFADAAPGAYRFVIERAPLGQSGSRFDAGTSFLLMAEVG